MKHDKKFLALIIFVIEMFMAIAYFILNIPPQSIIPLGIAAGLGGAFIYHQKRL